jgi:2-phospho-L-lactate guanylyltransferase
MTGSTYAILPIKRPEDAKTRLSPWLTEGERRALVFRMARDVLDALKGVPTVVVSPVDMRPFLKDYTFHFLKHEKPGLQSAVEAGNAYAVQQGAEATLFLPGDLPLVRNETIREILALGEEHRVIMSPSRRKGIGMLYRRPPGIIRARFSHKSLYDNLREARNKGLDVVIYRSPELYMDIDTPSDVVKFLKISNGTGTHRFLKKLTSRFR